VVESNKTVLIVDDEAIIRQCVQVELESHRGWKVLQADTGISGLATAKEQQPDLILLDVTIPKWTGSRPFGSYSKTKLPGTFR